MQYFNFTNNVLSFIVAALCVFAILAAEGGVRVVLAAILVILLVLPGVFPGAAVFWIAYAGKVIFGLGCYIYLKSQDFWIFGR